MSGEMLVIYFVREVRVNHVIMAATLDSRQSQMPADNTSNFAN